MSGAAESTSAVDLLVVSVHVLHTSILMYSYQYPGSIIEIYDNWNTKLKSLRSLDGRKKFGARKVCFQVLEYADPFLSDNLVLSAPITACIIYLVIERYK